MEDVTHGLMALVGGTDTSKQVTIRFQEAWNHEDEEERNLWREAIRKEFRDMIKRKVWEDFKKSKVPSSRRLIGTKWFFESRTTVDTEQGFALSDTIRLRELISRITLRQS